MTIKLNMSNMDTSSLNETKQVLESVNQDRVVKDVLKAINKELKTRDPEAEERISRFLKLKI